MSPRSRQVCHLLEYLASLSKCTLCDEHTEDSGIDHVTFDAIFRILPKVQSPGYGCCGKLVKGGKLII
jgi:hypothetical protein